MDIDPVILFFCLGLFAGIVRADIKLPAALYESISLFLLLTIGLKGGIELSKIPVGGLVMPVGLVILIGIVQTVMGYLVLRFGMRLMAWDAAAVAAHYGSVSVGTYAIVSSYLSSRQISYEPHMPVFVVALEIPAIIVGVLLARGPTLGRVKLSAMAHELFLGKG